MVLVSLVSVARPVPLSVSLCARPYVQRPSSRSHAYVQNISSVHAASSRARIFVPNASCIRHCRSKVLEPNIRGVMLCYEEASDVNSVVPASARQRRVLKYAHVLPSERLAVPIFVTDMWSRWQLPSVLRKA